MKKHEIIDKQRDSAIERQNEGKRDEKETETKPENRYRRGNKMQSGGSRTDRTTEETWRDKERTKEREERSREKEKGKSTHADSDTRHALLRAFPHPPKQVERMCLHVLS